MSKEKKPAVVIAALYKFVQLDNVEEIKEALLEVMERNQVRGSILVASEGINGTIASSRTGIDAFSSWLQQDERFVGLSLKESFADVNPFLRSKVKLKKEIVTIGIDEIDPTQEVGTYVDPEKWNDLISDPDVILIDARNDYECQMGSFKGAINPETDSFRELPDYLDQTLEGKEGRSIAMFCTGGIRCEKSTSYLIRKGFKNVFHLQGGILKYLEAVPEKDSLWEGECFVFDERVSVDHSLSRGEYDLCRACRMPISAEDKSSRDYVEGVSCPHCIDQKTEEDRARFKEREKQMRLAQERGEKHIGAETDELRRRKRAQKEKEREQQRARNRQP